MIMFLKRKLVLYIASEESRSHDSH